jgi:hypothetical protein
MTQFDSPDIPEIPGIPDIADTPTMDEVYKSARQLIQKGYSLSQTRNWLIRMGVDDEVAAEAVADVADTRPSGGGSNKGFSRTGHNVFGAVCLFLGLLVTVGSYAIASAGEIFVVAWGLILFGIIQLCMGMGADDK